MQVNEKMEEYCTIFHSLLDADSQFDYLYSHGLAPPEKGLLQPRNRLTGCQTAIWFAEEKNEDTVDFRLFSDSVSVNGVCSIFTDLYAGKRVNDIRNNPPVFLDEISDDVLYPDVKKGGFAILYKRLCDLTEKQMREGGLT